MARQIKKTTYDHILSIVKDMNPKNHKDVIKNTEYKKVYSKMNQYEKDHQDVIIDSIINGLSADEIYAIIENDDADEFMKLVDDIELQTIEAEPVEVIVGDILEGKSDDEKTDDDPKVINFEPPVEVIVGDILDDAKKHTEDGKSEGKVSDDKLNLHVIENDQKKKEEYKKKADNMDVLFDANADYGKERTEYIKRIHEITKQEFTNAGKKTFDESTMWGTSEFLSTVSKRIQEYEDHHNHPNTVSDNTYTKPVSKITKMFARCPGLKLRV